MGINSNNNGAINMTRIFSTALLATTILAAGTANADSQSTDKLATLPDESYVSVTGNIGDIRSNEFDLKYGNGKTITVELDQFGWEGNETKYLVPGESATVYGYIDDDLFEGREIEAFNIQLNESYVYYYNTDSGDNQYYNMSGNEQRDETTVSMTGQVSKVDDDQFTLTNKNGSVRVDVSELGYDPLDNQGVQQIVNGDRVYVYGKLDSNFFDKQEIAASGLVELVGTSPSGEKKMGNK